MTSPEPSAATAHHRRGLTPHTVLICDDQAELRHAVAKLLAHSPNFVVTGEAFDGPSCLEQVAALLPDLLILDVNMPGGGPQVAAAVRKLHPPIHILVFSGRQDVGITRSMLAAGADQYVLKTGRLKPFHAALDIALEQLTQAAGRR